MCTMVRHPRRRHLVGVEVRCGPEESRRSLFLDLLPLGAVAVLEDLRLPEGEARRLQELGFVPGGRVTAVSRAPGGGPRVYRVDGAEFALRSETASCIAVRLLP